MNTYMSNSSEFTNCMDDLMQNELSDIRVFLLAHEIEFQEEGLNEGWIVNDFLIGYNPINGIYSITYAGGEELFFNTRTQLYLFVLKSLLRS